MLLEQIGEFLNENKDSLENSKELTQLAIWFKPLQELLCIVKPSDK